jgi:hypothetical protein
MKSRYNDGGKLPPAEEAVRTAVLEPVPEVKTKRVVQKKDTAKSTPKSESRSTSNVFRAEMLERFGGKLKEPPRNIESAPMRKGGYVKKADGCATRGKTRGKMV